LCQLSYRFFNINVKFKKPLNEVFIDLDDYDPEEFGVEDFDKFDEIVEYELSYTNTE
jgi:hypothetical protein